MTKYFLLSLLIFCTSVHAQDLDIPLFDDGPILLGRQAPPLDSVRITPPPAPDIRVPLDNTPNKSPVLPDLPPLPPSEQIPLSPTPNAVPPEGSAETTSKGPLHNVSSFDIHGFSLGMSIKEALTQAKKLGFNTTLTQESVPLFYATDYANKCRQRGLVVPSQITQCIKDYACAEKTRYISEVKLVRKNETFQLYFTSNNTDNMLYKVIYTNKGDNSLNFTRINKAIKETRKKEFWAAVFDKYGYPDNERDYIWGDPQKAYMQVYMSGSAYDAFLILEDLTISGEDYFEAKDINEERPPYNVFSF